MRYKMILGQTLFSFLKKENNGLRIREVRFMNRDMNGEVKGRTRLLYDEESGRLQRYVNGSAPIASLPDDMVCFLAEVSRCFGRLSGEQSWEKDVWLCVDADVRPEGGQREDVQMVEDEAQYETRYEENIFPLAPLSEGGGELEIW